MFIGSPSNNLAPTGVKKTFRTSSTPLQCRKSVAARLLYRVFAKKRPNAPHHLITAKANHGPSPFRPLLGHRRLALGDWLRPQPNSALRKHSKQRHNRLDPGQPPPDQIRANYQQRPCDDAKEQSLGQAAHSPNAKVNRRRRHRHQNRRRL